MVVEELALWALVIVAVTSIIGSAHVLPRIRHVLSEEREAASILQDMLGELKDRSRATERRLADQQVRLDALELRVRRPGGPGNQVEALWESRAEPGEFAKSLPKAEAPWTTPTVIRRVAVPRVVTRTEREVLGFLLDGPKTPPEIRRRVSRSREHTARLLKKMFDEGYVNRSEVRKPFQYELTDRGRRLASR